MGLPRGQVSQRKERMALTEVPKPADRKDHIVVGGVTLVGIAAVRELRASGRSVVIVAQSQKEADRIVSESLGAGASVVVGDLTTPATFEKASLSGALALVLCSADDSTNLIAALAARAAYPGLRVIVSLTRPELRKTLEAAGVTFIASPQDMGGRLCASAAFRPEVAQALEDLTTATFGADLQEYMIGKASPLVGLSVAEAERRVREASDCLVLGIVLPSRSLSGPSNHYRTLINPPASLRFEEGSLVLVLGSLPNLHRFSDWYGATQGR